MKNHRLFTAVVGCCAAGMVPDIANAQIQGRSLTDGQLSALVKPNLAQCAANARRIDAASIIPTANARTFATDRVSRTLHGIWQGTIKGDDKDLGVDYFWIFDTKANQALIIALRNGKQSVASAKNVATAPKLTFLLCPHEGYVPSKDSSMLHEFVKVADTTDDAPAILQKATGLKLTKRNPSLADLWQGLLTSGYFESMPAEAFAGGYFKPMQIAHVANLSGPAGMALSWESEYRGGGSTSIKYVTGIPMNGVEHGEFVGTTTKAGDYLVSSPGNGKIWKVEASYSPASLAAGRKLKGSAAAFPAICYDLAFDAVTLGPLVN